MKKLRSSLIFIALFVCAAAAEESGCSGCGAGKLMLQCDYYVVKNGDLDKTDLCREYADAVDNDGAHAKAARYYLLGREPQKALRAALRAIEEGQTYAAQYAAEASLIFNEFKAAGKYMSMLKKSGIEPWSLEKDLLALKKIYPDTDFDTLMRVK